MRRYIQRGDVCSYVALSADVLEGVVPSESWLRYQVALAGIRDGLLDPVAFEEQVLTVVGDLLDLAGSNGFAGRSGARVERRMECVREQLSTDLDSQLTVHDVARELGVSPFHLVRQFKERTGWTMHAYRMQLRLRAAAELVLDDSGRSLADIAAMTGFVSHSHLTARFSCAFGATPSAVRSAA